MNDAANDAAGHSVTLDWNLVDEILTHLSEPSYSMVGQNLSLKLMCSVVVYYNNLSTEKRLKAFESAFPSPDECYFDGEKYVGGKLWWLQQDRWETWQKAKEIGVKS